jgi:O-antigen/teichoic acid export membrane protein
MKLRLTTQAGLLTLSRALGQVLNALVGIVVVRKLSQLDYGTFRQIFLLAATLLQTELGFVETLYFYLPTMPKLRAVFIRQTVVVVGTIQLLAGALMLVFRQDIAAFFNNPGLASCVDLMALYSGLTIITRIWEVELVADKRIPSAVLVGAGFESLKVILMAAALLLSPGIRPLLWALVAAAALKFAAFLVCLFGEFRWFTGTGPMRQGLPQIRYAMALWIPAILNGAIGGQAHQYIVGHYFDPSQYAIYAVACFQVPFVAILTNSISEVLLVRATEYCSEGRNLELYTLWMNACRKALLVYVAVAVVLMVLAQPIIVTIFTDRYRASAPLFAVMVLGLLSYGIFQDSLFRACSAMKTYGMFYALRAVLGVGLGFAGLKLWGLWGVALSTVLAVGIVNILQLVPAAKLLQVPFGKVLPWRDVAKMLLAAGVATSGVGILLCTSSSPAISLIAGFPLFGILYGGLVIKLGVVSSADVLVVLREIRTCFGRKSLTRWKSSLATQGF